MGMFDRIWVGSKNPFHLPPGEWQTKYLDNGLCEYRIDRHGRFIPISKKDDDGDQMTGDCHEGLLNGSIRAIDVRAYCSPANMDYTLYIRRGYVTKIVDMFGADVYIRNKDSYLNVHPCRRLWEMYIGPHWFLVMDSFYFKEWRRSTVKYRHIYEKIYRLLKQPNGNMRAHRYLDRILVPRLYP